MIQRIQSIWLLLASACAFATFKLPFYTGVDKSGIGNIKLLATTDILIMITTIIIGAMALCIIFLYKKRTLQLRLCVLGILLEAILIFLYYREVKRIFSEGEYALYALLHSLIVIFFFLAARAINKDEKLVKGSDRLR